MVTYAQIQAMENPASSFWRERAHWDNLSDENKRLYDREQAIREEIEQKRAALRYFFSWEGRKTRQRETAKLIESIRPALLQSCKQAVDKARKDWAAYVRSKHPPLERKTQNVRHRKLLAAA